MYENFLHTDDLNLSKVDVDTFILPPKYPSRTGCLWAFYVEKLNVAIFNASVEEFNKTTNAFQNI